ncbi:CpsB/CapC family capsule biosynthesis tyrosine phosphatase [Aquirufa antheringensis]
MSFLVNFFRRKVASKASPFDFLDVDIHNHVLPDLDDGAKDNATAISLLVELKKLGFSKVIASPKTVTQKYPNTPKSILRKYTALTNSIDTSSRILPNFCPPTSLYALDVDFPHIRKSGELLATTDNYVLVHFVDSVALSLMEAEIIELIYAGYKPILIHPERYISLHGNSPYFESLVRRGCHLGLSLLSLQGVYGRAVQKMAWKLMENQLYSFVGTGIKNQTHVKALQILASNHRMMKKLAEYPFLNAQLLD